MPRAIVGQRAHVDHRRAQLGQLALGQVRVVAVERVGHDEPEHRVAEELQPLVVRQAAVLVGVGPVGQGAFEQVRVDDDADLAEQRVQRAVARRGVCRLRPRFSTHAAPAQPWCSLRSAAA